MVVFVLGNPVQPKLTSTEHEPLNSVPGNTATSVLPERRGDVSNETGVVVITDKSGTCQT